MKTTIHNLIQGSDAWLQFRAEHFTASDAPAMMGASKYRSRSDLLAEKATGISPDLSDKQWLFDKGHEAEALVRPRVEESLGDDLFPVTVSAAIEGLQLSASMDGLNMDGDTGFECKLWNEDLAAQVQAGELEPHYYWQLEHQLLVSGADRIIFATGDADNLATFEYRAVPGRAEKLIAGWQQFAQDIPLYKPAAKGELMPAAVESDSLPALRIELSGGVSASNFPTFKARAHGVLQQYETDLRELTTDDDFGAAMGAVEQCTQLEYAIKAAKDRALSQTASIYDLFNDLDELAEQSKKIRCRLAKLVETEKQARKQEIVQRAVESVREHYASLDLGEYAIPLPQSLQYVIGGSIKNLRNLESITNAANTAAAEVKIAATQYAEQVRACIAVIDEHAKHAHLLPDHVTLAQTKTPEDLRNLIAVRVADAERREREAAERKPEANRSADAKQAEEPEQTFEFPRDLRKEFPTKPDNRPPMNLGEIRSALGLQVSQAFLAELGIEPAEKIKNSVIYAAADFPRICKAITAHIARALADWQSRKEAA